MKGHFIFSGAFIFFLVIFMKFSSIGRWFSGKQLYILDTEHSGLRREILERHKDLNNFYKTLIGESGIKRFSPNAMILPWAEMDLNFPLQPGSLGCEDLSHLTAVDYLGSGFTKLVLKGTLKNGRTIALKSINGEGNDVKRCLQLYGDYIGCFRLATYKLQKEMSLLQSLRHPGIIQLHGQCYDNSAPSDIRVTAMLEIGSPLEMIQLLQTPWEERFKICLDLVKLLHYLASSPLGSIALLDFQPRQFVLVGGSLKITDMDDAATAEQNCTEDADCALRFPSRTFTGTCSQSGTCTGANEKRNLFNAYRYFFKYLLPHAAPPALQPLLQDIMNATGDLRFGINETLEAFEKVLDVYRSGMYIHRRRHIKDYIMVKGFRLDDRQDEFRCWPSYNHMGCLISVHNTNEAAEFCSSHAACQNFVISQHKTWTGRSLASFTSSSAKPIPDVNSQVYIKRSRNIKL
ncbi:extracellular tyrosine-protein kinase PKDCC-like [Bombina bombina]|uniref:extracellular tyrosine-protein kinase PKDCC-like n=1 Tax=Bombina bombina TaxID=8345 RepID=UPI00235AB986|nr:extracellular tyrosine-protein kinase PKDCC-like [Bombina bombina]